MEGGDALVRTSASEAEEQCRILGRLLLNTFLNVEMLLSITTDELVTER